MRLILTILLIGLFKADAQMVINASAPYRPIGGFSGLLDDYSGAAVAYSLRKLDKDYTGAAIRVRKDTTGQPEQDIGFTASGDLDTASLKSFLNARSGFVTTWYSQGDSSGTFGVRNATQSIQGNQPIIALNGVIIRRGGEPVVQFDNTNDFLNISSLALFQNISHSWLFLNGNHISNNPGCFFGASTNTSSSSARIFLGSLVGTNKLGTGGRRLDANSFVSINSTTDKTTVITQLITSQFDFSNSDLRIFINGTQENENTTFQTNGNTSNTLSLAIRIGTFGTNLANCNLSELIIYTSDQTSNRSGIETNINNYYGIY